MLWDVDPAWQVFANISRSAEVPSFDVNSFASPASSNVDAQTATTYEIGTRGRAARHHVGRRALPRRDQERAAVPDDVAVQSLHRRERGPHRASGHRSSGSGSRSSSRSFAKEDRFWFNLAYTYNDFFFDGDARYGNNDLPGVPPHTSAPKFSTSIPAASTPARTSSGCRKYFSRQRQQLTIDPYALLNFRIGYESACRLVGLSRGAQPVRQALHRHHDHRRNGRRRIGPVQPRQRPRGVRRRPLSQMSDLALFHARTLASSLEAPTSLKEAFRSVGSGLGGVGPFNPSVRREREQAHVRQYLPPSGARIDRANRTAVPVPLRHGLIFALYRPAGAFDQNCPVPVTCCWFCATAGAMSKVAATNGVHANRVARMFLPACKSLPLLQPRQRVFRSPPWSFL